MKLNPKNIKNIIQAVGIGVSLIKIISKYFEEMWQNKLKERFERMRHKHKMDEMNRENEIKKERKAQKDNQERSTSDDNDNNIDEEFDDIECEDMGTIINDKSVNANGNFLFDTPFYKGGINLLIGAGGKGKSTVLMQSLISISTGERQKLMPEDWGTKSNNQQAIILDSEMDKMDYKSRYQNAKGIDLSKISRYRHIYSKEALVKHINKIVSKSQTDITIAIDNITSIFEKKLYDDQVTQFIASLNDIQLKALSDKGITVTYILLLHVVKNGKGNIDDMAGSKNWYNRATDVIYFKSLNENMLIQFNKNRKCKSPKNVIVKRTEDNYLHFEFVSFEEKVKETGTDNDKNTRNDNKKKHNGVIYNLPMDLWIEIEKMASYGDSYNEIIQKLDLEKKYGLHQRMDISRIIKLVRSSNINNFRQGDA